MKLTEDDTFNPQEKHHALSVLSQRLCIDLVMSSFEAFELADRSVASHMRLLTGMPRKPLMFYTHSPSEPILALAAAQALFQSRRAWAQALNSFSQNLCKSGVVEKGLVGELVARTILLIARDFAASFDKDDRPEMLQPVSVLVFFDTLFGHEDWNGQHRGKFEEPFDSMHLNFTHWLITMDCLPEKPDR